jgi:Pyridoxamine 5'-phosphate oxidase
MSSVASWGEIERRHPEFCVAVRGLLDARVHKTLATLRRDGAPRISGTEAWFADGELWFGSMWKARKALDLRRDSRFALHGGSVDPPDWTGDAKVSGRAVEILDQAEARLVLDAKGGPVPDGPVHLFRADLTDIVLTRLGDPADHLLIEFWTEAGGLQRLARA